MSRKIVEVTYIDPEVCFECGAPATERRHIIPVLLGGTKTIPLCGNCHAKVHGISGRKRTRLGELTKAALTAKKMRGEPLGGEKGQWGKHTNKTEVDRNKMLEGARKKSAESTKAAAKNNPNNKVFWEFMIDWQRIYGRISWRTNWNEIVSELNARGCKTATGLEFNTARAKAMWLNIQRNFNHRDSLRKYINHNGNIDIDDEVLGEIISGNEMAAQFILRQKKGLSLEAAIAYINEIKNQIK